MNRRSNILREIRINTMLLVSAFVLLLAGIHAHGQIVEKGVITGLVSDSTGANVSGARVSLYNMATDISTDTTTNSQGLFVSPPLDPGDYDVQIKTAGFKTVHQSVRLEVGQRASANITLPVGNSSETIEVKDNNQEILQTESSTIENLRTEEAVKDLPLNGRNFNELFSLGAGVIPTTTQSVSIPYTQQRGPSWFAINGARYQENRTLLDGIGDNENHNSMTALFPPIDAIQEFSEETEDADARYGRGTAAPSTWSSSPAPPSIMAMYSSSCAIPRWTAETISLRAPSPHFGKMSLALPSAGRSNGRRRRIPRLSSSPTMPESAWPRARQTW